MLKSLIISTLLSCGVASGSVNRYDMPVENPDMRYYYQIGSFNQNIRTTTPLLYNIAPYDFGYYNLYIDMYYNFEFELYVDRTEDIDYYDNVYYRIKNLTSDYNIHFYDIDDGFYNLSYTYSTYGGVYVQPGSINYHNYINDNVANIETTLFTIDDLIDNTMFNIDFAGLYSHYIEISAGLGANEKVRFNLPIDDEYANLQLYDYNGVKIIHNSQFSTRSFDLYENTTFYDDITYYVQNFDPSLLYDGYQDGYDVGYSIGSKEGYTNGYIQGSNDALSQDVTISTIFNGIFGISLLPINMFLSMFNFEVLGINISGIVSALLTVAMVVIVVRFVFGNKSGGGSDKGE